MTAPEFVEIKLVSSPELIDGVKKTWGNRTNDIEILSSGPETDPTCLGFDLGDPNNLVVLVKVIYLLGPFCATLYKHVMAKRSTVSIQSPWVRLDIIFKEDLTEAEVMQILKQLAELRK